MITPRNRLSILLLAISLFSQGILDAQSIQFKKYVNQAYHFSFDIPSYWTIRFNKDQGGLICVPLTKQEMEKYKDCFEGIVFRMELFNSNLDSTLATEGVYTKVGDTYYTTDRTRDSVKSQNIKGSSWNGIYHDNVCGIMCADGFHAAAGQCEFMYFSNGKTTVCINTNGRELDDAVLKKLLNSFRFYQ
jgi:hypothetical protein